jgi:hypothetical protein
LLLEKMHFVTKPCANCKKLINLASGAEFS